MIPVRILSEECHIVTSSNALFYSVWRSGLCATNFIGGSISSQTTKHLYYWNAVNLCFILPVTGCDAGWVGNVYSAYCLRHMLLNGTYQEANSTCNSETGQPSSIVKPYLPEIYVMMENMELQQSGKCHTCAILMPLPNYKLRISSLNHSLYSDV